MSKIFSNIFLLNNINDLDSLNQIFNKRYNELLFHGVRDEQRVAQMIDTEKYFFYSWREVGEIEEILLPKVSIDTNSPEETSETIRYQKAVANLEYSKKKRKDENGNFLPKSDRVNNYDVHALFFEKDDEVYVLINSSNEYHINRVIKLIGENEMGENEISGANPRYSLDLDLFNWLIYVYTEREGALMENMKLENISGFEGNVTDAANVFTGASQQTTELIATKAFISNGGELKKITIRVRDTDIDITCVINENSNVVINCNVSDKFRLLDNLDNDTFFQLYLYGYLILKLKQLYSMESNSFITEENPRFSKKIGIDVIKSIVEKNNITLADLEAFLVVTSSESDQELI